VIISAIVAVAQNGVIGRENDLPWRLPNDLRHFKEVTLGHHIILGRKNFDSIGRALPGRTSLVLSRNPKLEIPGCIVMPNLAEALNFARIAGESEAFIIGGAEIYKLALPQIDKLYLTEVLADVKGDVYFPDYDRKQWKVISNEFQDADEKNEYPHRFLVLERL
jgi:dihydrofolate reductase